MATTLTRHDDYLEVRLKVPTPTFDLLCGALHEVRCLGFQYENEDPQKRIPVTAYFHPDVHPAGVIERLVPWLKTEDDSGTVVCTRIPDQDWDALWRSTYQPIEVGSDLVILPSWSTDEYAGRTVVRIKPERAFGTGSHETTRLCLNALTRTDLRGSRVADVGTGSGILAIASVKLGALCAHGCDPDPDALVNARHNVDLNAVAPQVMLFEGEMTALQKPEYDIILANLVLAPLIRNASLFKGYLATHGTLFLSGLLGGQLRVLEPHLQSGGLVVKETHEDNGWIMVTCVTRESLSPS